MTREEVIMFPTNWNDPYRKKDGTLVNMEDMGSGGGGGSELPDYSQADAGKVLTVGEDGELEWNESGAGGGDALLSYDFTKWLSRTWGSATCAADGASISSYTGYIPILSGITYSQLRDITIYIDSTKIEVDTERTQHQRAIMGTTERGIIYEKSNHKWSFYGDNGWEYGDVSDPEIFDNSKIKVYIDSAGKWTVYSNDVLVFQSSAALTITDIRIGASDNSVKSAIITGARIYSGNYTE